MEERFSDLKQDITNYVYAGTIVFIVLALVFIIFLFLSIRRRNKMLYEKQTLEQKFQQELLKTQIEIQEQTFKTISQEIHDNIGQVLSLAKLNLNTLDFSKEEAVKQKTTSAKELVGKAIQDLRDLSKTLNTENISSLGLPKAIQQELQLLEKTGTFKGTLEVEGTFISLEPQKELIIFRIIQEALNNIIKHAKATFIRITLSYTDNFRIVISDNGRGFDPNETTFIEGSGLRNMQSRSALINAEFTMNSNPDHGTSILISLPLT
jgi:signal transduction histidine kinase